MRPALYVVAVTLATIALCVIATNADAYTLGAADGSAQAAPLAAQLGARTYRIVMDPTVPLDTYAHRIDTYRAAGMVPQLVIGGTGTTRRGRKVRDWKIINYAVAAFRRWPDAYSVSVVNEPDTAGASVCGYTKTFRTAYKMLKAAGAPRVLFGEFSPFEKANRWIHAIDGRCGGNVTADGFAWHCYDHVASHTLGIFETGRLQASLRQVRSGVHTPRGFTLPMYCTEFGVPTGAMSEQAAAHLWQRAMRAATAHNVVEVVAWQILPTSDASAWDTSLVDAHGRERPAFATIASAR